MIIGVAIGTEGKLQPVGVGRFVTALAFDCLMPSEEREVGLAVIEAVDAFDHGERYIGMALSAILTEPVLMWILVTGRAIIEFKTCKYLEFFVVPGFDFMTVGARHFLVLP
jgi:hypothetical protein